MHNYQFLFSYEVYAKPLQSTYDNVVESTLDLLKEWTLDQRVNKLNFESKTREVSQVIANINNIS